MIRPPQRRTVAALTLSAAALVGIVLHEGYTDRAVIPVKGDVPTIGFGHSSLQKCKTRLVGGFRWLQRNGNQRATPALQPPGLKAESLASSSM